MHNQTELESHSEYEDSDMENRTESECHCMDKIIHEGIKIGQTTSLTQLI